MMDTEPRPVSEREQIEDWRERELIRAGFMADDAIELSRRSDVDLHRARSLIARGCNPCLAAEILR